MLVLVLGNGLGAGSVTVTRSISSSCRFSFCVWHLASGNYADAANCCPGLAWSGLGVKRLLPGCALPFAGAISGVCSCACTHMSVHVLRICLVSRICCSACATPAAALLLPLFLSPTPSAVLIKLTHTNSARSNEFQAPRGHMLCSLRDGESFPQLCALVLAEAATLHPQLIASPLARLLCHTSGCKLWHISNT